MIFRTIVSFERGDLDFNFSGLAFLTIGYLVFRSLKHVRGVGGRKDPGRKDSMARETLLRR
jgi:hypothetical protein